eukprot:CAMPEP_0171999744 /NCGR_PEP_ID=MMETSP1041-20130122/1942_1 /TAXON_ID=464988 /ORGANISM="Hemiselmis andersenii, Strain CCMP439" /LENGTH=166 /DNA_ID=CAMNT_0012653223 /DNA_START=27 /DNA_END=527 /DNA_ORIENTATION=-
MRAHTDANPPPPAHAHVDELFRESKVSDATESSMDDGSSLSLRSATLSSASTYNSDADCCSDCCSGMSSPVVGSPMISSLEPPVGGTSSGGRYRPAHREAAPAEPQLDEPCAPQSPEGCPRPVRVKWQSPLILGQDPVAQVVEFPRGFWMRAEKKKQLGLMVDLVW